MVQTVQKNIRVSPEEWERIEKAADERGVSANQLLLELAIEALDRREWPRTEAEIRLMRSITSVPTIIPIKSTGCDFRDSIKCNRCRKTT